MENTELFVKKQAKMITDLMYEHLDSDFRTTDFFKASRYTIGPEGHGYRSILSLEIYKSLGGNAKEFLKALVGIEYIHHSSLIFDDLPCMDNSKMRKGKRTTHLAFSESTAILAALYLFDRGKLLICESATKHLKEEDFRKFQRFLSNNLTKLLSGQEDDLKNSKKAKGLIQMMENKNRMFYLACVVPSLFLNKKYFQKLDYIGKQIAVAYQYFDDLRDQKSSSLTGKPKGQDKDRVTSLSEYGERGVQKRLNGAKQNILNKISAIDNKNRISDLIEHILSHPS